MSQFVPTFSLHTVKMSPPTPSLFEPSQDSRGTMFAPRTFLSFFFFFFHPQVAAVRCTMCVSPLTLTLQGHETCSLGNHKTRQRKRRKEGGGGEREGVSAKNKNVTEKYKQKSKGEENEVKNKWGWKRERGHCLRWRKHSFIYLFLHKARM